MKTTRKTKTGKTTTRGPLTYQRLDKDDRALIDEAIALFPRKKKGGKAATLKAARGKKTPQLPLALQMMGRRCDPDDTTGRRIDGELFEAYNHVRRFLASGSSKDDIRVSILETAISHRDLQQKAESRINRAFARAFPERDASEAIGNLKYHARWDGCLMGLAIAYEIHRSFNDGGAR